MRAAVCHLQLSQDRPPVVVRQVTSTTRDTDDVYITNRLLGDHHERLQCGWRRTTADEGDKGTQWAR